MKSKTDWEKLRRMKDSEIDLSDIPELDKDFFDKSKIRKPKSKKNSDG